SAEGLERSAVLLFNTLFLFSLVRAYAYLRSGEMVLQRRWVLRAVAILLGIATTRLVMGLFFASSRLTHLEPDNFSGWLFGSASRSTPWLSSGGCTPVR